MTDRAQFEAMLEALINDDQDQAKEIFHNIVVSKSREIYEELLAEDFSQDSGNPYGKKDDDEEVDESGEPEPAPEEAPMEGEDDEEDMPADDEEDDAEDDMDMGDEEGEDSGDMEDRVMDLEDALEDLKAEFEQLLSQEDEEGGHDMDAIHGADDMGDMGDMDAEMDENGMPIMEYYKKVSVSHGDNGVNNKSTVAGKNDMGGTTANMTKSFSTTSGGTTGGLAKNTAGDLTKGMNVHNRVQSNAGKTAFKKSEPGHGAEKAGKKETADNKQSMLNGAPKRAK
jgi:hypothetical protein